MRSDSLKCRRSVFVGCLSSAAGAAVLLGLVSPFFDPGRLHFSGLDGTLNDQVGYITVARNLVERGVLESNVIYPSVLSQGITRNYLYMPGHYWALAVGYLLFGHTALAYLLPSLAGFVVASVCIWLTGSRLYDPGVAALAVIFFLSFPPDLIYAFTAMAELTFLTAGILAFCVFVHIPDKCRLLGGPFLLVLPFLFRETGALYVIPMALMLSANKNEAKPRTRLARMLPFILACVLLLSLIYSRDFSSGRGSLFWPNLYHAGETDAYGDAYFRSGEPVSWSDVLSLVARKVRINGEMVWFDIRYGLQSLEGTSTLIMLYAMIAVLLLGYRQRSLDPFLLACGRFMFVNFVLVVVFYHFTGFRGVRALLFTWPLACIALARIAVDFVRTRLPQSAGTSVILLACLSLGLGLKVICGQGPAITKYDPRDQLMLGLLEGLNHDDRKLLVAPWRTALAYTYHHYAVKWSFVPANDQTLELLHEQFNVGTLVVPHPAGGISLTPEGIARSGLTLKKIVSTRAAPWWRYMGVEYDLLIYQ